MEVNGLARFAIFIVLIGAIVGVGVLILDRMSTSPALYNDVTVANESVSWGAPQTNRTLAHGNISSFTSVANIAGTAYGSGNYSINTSAGILTVLSNTTGIGSGATVYVYYTYEDRNSEATQALVAARDALSDLATSWLGLIVLIGALAVILVMVIRSFAGERAR